MCAWKVRPNNVYAHQELPRTTKNTAKLSAPNNVIDSLNIIDFIMCTFNRKKYCYII